MNNNLCRCWHNMVLVSACLASSLFMSNIALGDQSLPLIPIDSPISSAYYPVSVSGRSLPMLHGTALSYITLYIMRDAMPTVIPFQVDRRKPNGQYAVDDDDSKRSFTADDEIVFMAQDVGLPATGMPALAGLETIASLRIGDDTHHGMVYVGISNVAPAPRSAIDYVDYDSATDSLHSDIYSITFSAARPFLIEDLRWRDGDGYGPDIADIMKVRHTGKLFGRFDFKRTEADYSSRIVAVRDGPVRVIRQTRNRVRVLWTLKSPSVDMDYIAYANHIVMDTTLDFPFKIGWFFKDVVTFASMDLAGRPQTRMYDPTNAGWMVIDGTMSEAEQHYNAGEHKDFIMADADGLIVGTMHLTDSLPIRWHTQLIDDVSQADPPETITGQTGNIGFETFDWETVDTDIHHLYYSFYLLPSLSPGAAQQILKEAPRYGQL